MSMTCDVCTREFVSARSDARYCSGRCRTIAYRRRAEPDRKPAKRRPLPDVLRGTSLGLYKLTAAAERCADDDRLPRLLKAGAVQHYGNDLRREAERLLSVADRLDPATADRLAIPQPPRRGRRRSPEAVLDRALVGLSGFCLALDEVAAITLTPVEADRARADLNSTIRTLTRIRSLI